eukprot:4520602-Alexandrium_andersonii.AAC.1
MQLFRERSPGHPWTWAGWARPPRRSRTCRASPGRPTPATSRSSWRTWGSSRGGPRRLSPP